MFNAKLDAEVIKVEPHNDEKNGIGIKLHVRVETNNRKIFDDVDFAGKEEGVSRILSGEIPIKGASASLAFVRPSLEMEYSGQKHIPVELHEVLTGPMKENKVTVDLKIDIKRMDKEIAGELAASIKEIIEIKLKKQQEELPMHTRN